MDEIRRLKLKAREIRTRILSLLELMEGCDIEDRGQAVEFLDFEITRLLGMVAKIERLTRGFESRAVEVRRLDTIAERVFGQRKAEHEKTI